MSPTFSGECAVLALLAVILGFALLGAIAALSIHVRRSVLGKQLLDACAGDYETAVKAIANVRAENELFDDILRDGMRGDIP